MPELSQLFGRIITSTDVPAGEPAVCNSSGTRLQTKIKVIDAVVPVELGGTIDLLGPEGLVDLLRLPEEVRHRCRVAWSRLRHMPTRVVHADPGIDNIFVTEDQVVCIDWDEARVDASSFDLAALPDEACPLNDEERWVARQVASAWEAAISWDSDREYAMWRLGEVGAS